MTQPSFPDNISYKTVTRYIDAVERPLGTFVHTNKVLDVLEVRYAIEWEPNDGSLPANATGRWITVITIMLAGDGG